MCVTDVDVDDVAVDVVVGVVVVDTVCGRCWCCVGDDGEVMEV